MANPAARATVSNFSHPQPRTGGASAASLLSRYRLDEGSVADDVSGVNGTKVGTWTSEEADSLVVEVGGQAFYKAGGTAAVTLPANQAAHALSGLSISFYYQPSANTNKHVLFAGAGTPSNGIGDFSIERLTNGRLRAFHVGQDGDLRFFGSTDGITTTNLVVGTAYRITLTLGSSGAKLYLDDDLVAEIPQNQNGWNNSRTKFIGIWVDGVQSPAQGVFDDVRIYNGELTASGIAALEPAQSITLPVSGSYTPFSFITISNPSVNHSGVTGRPSYSASDPRSASFIDPMSGLEVFRVGGNSGSSILINNSTNSGLVFPTRLRNQNNSKGFMVWNADSTLLMISRRFSQTGDPANSASSYIIDVDGSHGASVPWRIIRANPAQDLAVAGLSADWFFWDPLNPLRAYAVGHNGSLWEWWPIGGSGHSVGEKTQLFGALPSGFGNVHGSDDRPGACHPTPDGRFRMVPCQRTSDSMWGGFRQNIQTGQFSSFIGPEIFNYTGSSAIDNDRSSVGISFDGQYTAFNENGRRFKFRRISNNTEISDNAPEALTSHVCYIERDGVQYFCGVLTDNVSMFNIAAVSYEQKITTAQFQGSNPNHLGALNWNDTFETYGAAGSGSSTGIRYCLYTRSGARNGHPRAIMGIRMGVNDTNQFRYLCNHRSIRTSNSSECHAQMDPNARFVVFPSNWHEPGVVNDGHVHPYVCVIPDGWKSPNNDGS